MQIVSQRINHTAVVGEKHRMLFPSDLPDDEKLFFLQNSKNTPKPSTDLLSTDILNALEPVLKYLSKVAKIYPSTTTLQDTNACITKKPRMNEYEVMKDEKKFKIGEDRIILLYNLHKSGKSKLNDFSEDLFELLSREMINNKMMRDIGKETEKNVLNALNRFCGPLMEYSSTPLMVNTLSMGFFSDEQLDSLFGGNRNVFNSIWSIPGFLGINIQKEALDNYIAWALMSLSICPDTYFFIFHTSPPSLHLQSHGNYAQIATLKWGRNIWYLSLITMKYYPTKQNIYEITNFLNKQEISIKFYLSKNYDEKINTIILWEKFSNLLSFLIGKIWFNCPW